MPRPYQANVPCFARFVSRIAPCMALGALVLTGGCSGFFNQSFLSLVSNTTPGGEAAVGAVSIDNAPGHIPIIFINNARFDQSLLDYFERIGVDISDPNLRPRFRVRTGIEYVNGNTLTVEFIDGSSIVQGSVQTTAGAQRNPLVPVDLTENDLTNLVAVCDVRIVRPGGAIDDQQLSVEVFVPAFLKEIQVIVTELGIVQSRELVQTINPQFVPLRADDVDENFNITTLRNFDIRDVPVPATNLICGSVVGFTISGTLRLPFVQDELGDVVPGFLDTDDAAQAAAPGRFEFRTTVR